MMDELKSIPSVLTFLLNLYTAEFHHTEQVFIFKHVICRIYLLRSKIGVFF